MMDESRITTDELAQRTGIPKRTLNGWKRMGVIPSPEVGLHPSGRGKVGYWPESMVRRCKKIKELQRLGYNLKSAAFIEANKGFVVDVTDAQNRPTGEQIYERAIKQANLKPETSANKVFMELTECMLANHLLESSVSVIRVTLDEGYYEALRILKKGYYPVLWFDGGFAQVVPEAVASLRLREHDRMFDTAVVLPLYGILCRVAKLNGDPIPKPSNIKPLGRVLIEKGTQSEERDFRLTGRSGYELGELVKGGGASSLETGKTKRVPAKKDKDNGQTAGNAKKNTTKRG